MLKFPFLKASEKINMKINIGLIPFRVSYNRKRCEKELMFKKIFLSHKINLTLHRF